MAHDEYRVRSRGDIEVKGKGTMSTFFLIGSKSKFVKEPNDEFTKLPVVQPKSEHGTLSEHQGIEPQSTGTETGVDHKTQKVKKYKCLIM